jgi:hypothetical protein
VVTVVGALAVTAAYEVFAFGVIAWSGRVRAWLLRPGDIVGVTLGVVAITVSGITMVAAPARLLSAVVAAAAFVLAGVGLVLSAYYRWTQTEFPMGKPSKTVASS